MNPQLIPDDVAYANFFRMLSRGNATPDAERQQKSYIRHVLLRATGQASESDVRKVLRFVESYEARLRASDEQRPRGYEDSQLIRDITSAMKTHLGAGLVASIDQYVRNDFKRKTKIIKGRQ